MTRHRYDTSIWKLTSPLAARSSNGTSLDLASFEGALFTLALASGAAIFIGVRATKAEAGIANAKATRTSLLIMIEPVAQGK